MANEHDRGRTVVLPGDAEPRQGANLDNLSTQVITDKSSLKVAVLKVVAGPGKGEERPVFSGTNQVGRSADNRIPLDFGDNTISRQQHAVISYDASSGEFRIFDGGKQNPVHVNGERLSGDRPLSDGDTIKIGLTTLRFALM
ncbi:MAG: FHA domain-containing protein [Proteobacteria bacterium]|nr:FHA domain-containing protein [Pseudomonadota bacterium]